ncbi:MAG: methyltransferase domain-containing protein [Fimbriimonadaceae bacterium]
MRTAEELASLMAAHAVSPDAQLTQIQYRQTLVEHWQIPEGSSVLEVGCGQGDTTIVLADAVGETGRVVAIDSAPATYGKPISLGEAAARIKSGPLGDQVEFRFDFDLLNQHFRPDEFDFVVMAHCLWYFDSLSIGCQMLERVRPWARTLCLAEWELAARKSDQMMHFLAVFLQGQVGESESNIRTPTSWSAVDVMISTTGWNVTSKRRMDTSKLDDARWEIANAMTITAPSEEVAEQVDSLKCMSEMLPVVPLDSYSVVASRMVLTNGRWMVESKL